jgi:hypothetical protein
MAEHSAHQPDPHVGRNLVIPATTSVKLAANVFADDFRQSTLVRRMDILVIGFDVELSMCSVVLLAILPNSAKSRSSLRTLPFFHSSSTTRKPPFNLGLLVRGNNPSLLQGFRERYRAFDICGIHPLVVSQ